MSRLSQDGIHLCTQYGAQYKWDIKVVAASCGKEQSEPRNAETASIIFRIVLPSLPVRRTRTSDAVLSCQSRGRDRAKLRLALAAQMRADFL
eukprot:CAMPEP_0119397528 /NCGR_PEP_ID=MMETSP1334-20130426/140379_1 /TAXON_ID=127549 /ORGANISM="Calcidiscus leptoporus, Strain RCC1130" /LENGTH=91 /DNA_ID=CAMNT_0007421371 /DNA_START=1272 /DNA_END=1543 /DNA_ORIENTATION=+